MLLTIKLQKQENINLKYKKILFSKARKSKNVYLKNEKIQSNDQKTKNTSILILKTRLVCVKTYIFTYLHKFAFDNHYEIQE